MAKRKQRRARMSVRLPDYRGRKWLGVRLPRESRDLVFLRFTCEMSYAEIAKTTGFGEASLRGKVFRSLKLLRRELEQEEVTHAV